MTGDFFTRPYNPAVDNDQDIAAAHLRIREWQVADGTGEFADLYDSQADLSDISGYYVAPGGGFFVARDTTTSRGLLGFIGLRRDGAATAEVKRFAVFPEYRGRGVGTALVRMLVSWAPRYGIDRLHLAAGAGESAKGLYEAAGFAVVGFDAPNNDHLMVWAS